MPAPPNAAVGKAQPRWYTPARLVGYFCLVLLLTWLDQGLVASNQVTGDDDSGRPLGFKALFGLSSFQLGLLPACYSVGLVAAGFVFSHLAAAHVNSFRLIGVGMLCWSLGVVLTGAATSYGMLIAARIIAGCGEAPLLTLTFTFVDDVAPPASATLWFAALGLFPVVGMTAGYVVAEPLTSAVGGGGGGGSVSGLRWAFYIEALVSIPLTAFALFMPAVHLNTADAAPPLEGRGRRRGHINTAPAHANGGELSLPPLGGPGGSDEGGGCGASPACPGVDVDVDLGMSPTRYSDLDPDRDPEWRCASCGEGAAGRLLRSEGPRGGGGASPAAGMGRLGAEVEVVVAAPYVRLEGGPPGVDSPGPHRRHRHPPDTGRAPPLPPPAPLLRATDSLRLDRDEEGPISGVSPSGGGDGGCVGEGGGHGGGGGGSWRRSGGGGQGRKPQRGGDGDGGAGDDLSAALMRTPLVVGIPSSSPSLPPSRPGRSSPRLAAYRSPGPSVAGRRDNSGGGVSGGGGGGAGSRTAMMSVAAEVDGGARPHGDGDGEGDPWVSCPHPQPHPHRRRGLRGRARRLAAAAAWSVVEGCWAPLELLRHPANCLNNFGYAPVQWVFGMVTFWGPKALQELFGLTGSGPELLIGAIGVVTGVTGTLVGGVALDRWGSSLRNGFLLQTVAVAVALLALQLAFTLATSVVAFCVLLSVGMFSIFASQAPSYALSMWTVPPKYRPLSQASIILLQHALGDVPSPPSTGALYDRTGSWRTALAASASGLGAAVVLFGVGAVMAAAGRARDFRLAEKEEGEGEEGAGETVGGEGQGGEAKGAEGGDVVGAGEAARRGQGP